MDFLLTIIVTTLQGYLALTNHLAERIEVLINPITAELVTEEIRLLPLTSEYSNGSGLTDILLRSREYQQATVIGSVPTSGATTNDPLEALVNIFCTLRTTDSIRTTTGTGVFIDSSGVILTNAHVAQFLLLQNTARFEDARCIIRTGNPAAARYTAELLYIPPAWIQKHAALISQTAPTGTGERDYALLYVTSSLLDDPLPNVFPALSSNVALVPRSVQDSEVIVAGYPATSLERDGSQGDLLQRLATTSISQLYTFGSNYADVMGVRGSVVGANGSSGGPVITADGRIIGLITTRGDNERDGVGSLRAITLSHIDRTIQEETGFSLQQNLQGDVPYRASIFNTTLAPFLTQTLELNYTN